jgi:hypothetical protein
MNIKRRVKSLEEKFGGTEMTIFVHPSAPIPEHDFDSDKEYFGAKVAERLGHDNFKLCVFSADERKQDTFVWVKDFSALSRFVSKYSSRVGMPPNPLRTKKEELEAFAEVL